MKEVEEVIVSEESQSADNLAATVLSEDPHTVLVEFSSVVADTQEYIIEVRRGSRPAHWELSTGFVKKNSAVVHVPAPGFREKVKQALPCLCGPGSQWDYPWKESTWSFPTLPKCCVCQEEGRGD